MPVLRLASAPNRSPITVVKPIAKTTPTHGLQWRWRPFVPGPVTAFASTSPEIP